MSLHRNPLADRVQRAASVAARHADDVDAQGRFPAEACEALRAERLLGAFLPRECGGEGLSFADAAHACAQLAQACGATGGLFARHQAALAALRRAADEDEPGLALLRRIAWQGRLVAVAADADGAAQARIEPDGDVTAGRSGMDAFGLRGLAAGASWIASGAAVPRAIDLGGAFVAETHILWSAWCCGVAAGSLRRAEDFVRRGHCRSDIGAAAPRLTGAAAALQTMRSATRDALARYGALADEDAIRFACAAAAARRAAGGRLSDILHEALSICGASGAARTGPHSLSRLARDAMCEPVWRNDASCRRPSCACDGISAGRRCVGVAAAA